MMPRSAARRMAVVVLAAALAITCACTSGMVYEAEQIPAMAGAVNINTATIAELEALPGVGRRTAQAIVDHRARNGEFRRVEHVMLVQGMSEKRFLEMIHLITH